jgi:transposase InsO family protein
MDFIVDGLATVRMVRILSVVDAHTRKCMALEADTSLGSGSVTQVLEWLIAWRERPENVRSDNGHEFTSRRMLAWSETGRSTWFTSSQAVRCRTVTSRSFTAACAMSASTEPGSGR